MCTLTKLEQWLYSSSFFHKIERDKRCLLCQYISLLENMRQREWHRGSVLSYGDEVPGLLSGDAHCFAPLVACNTDIGCGQFFSRLIHHLLSSSFTFLPFSLFLSLSPFIRTNSRSTQSCQAVSQSHNVAWLECSIVNWCIQPETATSSTTVK